MLSSVEKQKPFSPKSAFKSSQIKHSTDIVTFNTDFYLLEGKQQRYQSCSVFPTHNTIANCVVLNPQHLKNIDLPKKKN